MIKKEHVINIPLYLEYWRKPTLEEIKFGHGALHYRDFEFDKCFDQHNNLILKARASDDNLIYFYSNIEHSISKLSNSHSIQCD